MPLIIFLFCFLSYFYYIPKLFVVFFETKIHLILRLNIKKTECLECRTQTDGAVRIDNEDLKNIFQFEYREILSFQETTPPFILRGKWMQSGSRAENIFLWDGKMLEYFKEIIYDFCASILQLFPLRSDVKIHIFHYVTYSSRKNSVCVSNRY